MSERERNGMEREKGRKHVPHPCIHNEPGKKNGKKRVPVNALDIGGGEGKALPLSHMAASGKEKRLRLGGRRIEKEGGLISRRPFLYFPFFFNFPPPPLGLQ